MSRGVITAQLMSVHRLAWWLCIPFLCRRWSVGVFDEIFFGGRKEDSGIDGTG